ncbi:unnamed protein product, partial [Ixodes hexagonus]
MLPSLALKPPLPAAGMGTPPNAAARGGAKLRARSSSAGRGPDKGLRARYWAYLFENLQRAVDEIYHTCETDESTLECKEAILILENYRKEFTALINWIQLSKQLESTPPPERQGWTASWEVRKPSLGKAIPRNFMAPRHGPAQRPSRLTVGTQCGPESISAAATPRAAPGDHPAQSPVLLEASEKECVPKVLPETVKSANSLDSGTAATNHQADGMVSMSVPELSVESTSVQDSVGTAEDATRPFVPTLEVCKPLEEDRALEKVSALEQKNKVSDVTSSSEDAKISGNIEIASDANVSGESECPRNSDAEASKALEESSSLKLALPLERSKTPEVSDEASAVSKTSEVVKSQDSSKSSEASNSDGSKSTASAKTTAVSKTADTSKPSEVSKVPEPSKTPEAPKEAPKLGQAATALSQTCPPAKPASTRAPRTGARSAVTDTKSRTTPEPKPASYSSSLKTGPPTQRFHAPSRPSAPPSSRPGTSNSTRTSMPARGAAASSTSVPTTSVRKTATLVTPPKPVSSATKTLGEVRKSESTLSLSSTSSGHSWADMVKGPNACGEVQLLTKSASLDPMAVDLDDSEGWETVCRNRTRSRNSPPKKFTPRQPTAPNPHYQSDSSRGGVTRSPSAPMIAAPATRPKTRRSSAPLSSGPPVAKNPRPRNVAARDHVGPRSATSMPSLALRREPKKIAIAVSPAPKLGSKSKSFVASEEKERSRKRGGGDQGRRDRPQSQKASHESLCSLKAAEENEVETVDRIVLSRIASPQEDTRTDAEEIATNIVVSPFEDDGLDADDSAAFEAEELVYEMGLSWGEQMDCLEDLELRTPGRALQMHEKLSSASRKRPLSETLQRHQEKQAKAQEQRERIREEKAQRCRDLSKKVEEKKAQQEELQLQRRQILEKRLQRAAEKREMQLKNKVKRAHDEEEKVNEIAFINTLEAQNKRIDLMSKEKDHEARLQDIQGERQRKLEEKAAKEAAAEERRKVLEAERQAKLLEIKEKRKLKDEKVQQQQQEKEKLRQSLLKQKEREREQRLTALNAAQLATTEELQKKIQLKQEESARRHEENMEQIRLKAFELSVRKCSSNDDAAPLHVPYETKKICSLCNVLIGSEVYLLSHLRGKKHQEAIRENYDGVAPSAEELESYNLKHIVDASADQLDPSIALDRERQKAHRKRCKKLRHKMSARGRLYEKTFAEKPKALESKNKMRLAKALKEIGRCLGSQGQGPWEGALVSSLDRALGELERTLSIGNAVDADILCHLGGFSSLMELLGCILKATAELPTVVPSRCLVRACAVLKVACEKSASNCSYLVLSNRVGVLLDILTHRLNLSVPDEWGSGLGNGRVAPSLEPGQDPVATALLGLLHATLRGVTNTDCEVQMSDDNHQRLLDVISYAVSMGTVDKLAQCLGKARAPLDSDSPQLTEFLVQAMEFVACLARLVAASRHRRQKEEDPTQLAATFGVTQLAGSVSLLYGTLLQMGAPSGSRAAGQEPPALSPGRLAVTAAALDLLNQMGHLDLLMFQVGHRGCKQLRHIASFLLWYCSHWEERPLLNQVVLLVGHFAVLSPDNQAVIQSGEQPTLLQLLCTLPFEYFSDPELTQVLFPTLVSCCFGNEHNRAVLEQELSPVLLANYVEVSENGTCSTLPL